jgi:hypothetical protein
MRRLVAIAAFVLLGVGVGATALAAEPVGPSGSTFDGAVVCGTNHNFLQAPIVVHNDTEGAEVCSNELGTRVILQSNKRPTIGPLHGPAYLHADVYNTHVLDLPLIP